MPDRKDNELQGKGLTPFPTDSPLTGKQIQFFLELAKREGIPPYGLTILGGNPYINTTGLDFKLKTKMKEEDLVVSELRSEALQRPEKDNGMKAIARGYLKLFDRSNFMALAKSSKMSVEELKELREIFTYSFSMEGVASPETLKMRSMQNVDFIIHMAERRATNRAKREAVGTGLTCDVEMPETVQYQYGTEQEYETETKEPPKLKVKKPVKNTPAEIFDLAEKARIPVWRMKEISKKFTGHVDSQKWTKEDMEILREQIKIEQARENLRNEIKTLLQKKVLELTPEESNKFHSGFPDLETLIAIKERLQSVEIEEDEDESD